MYLVAVLSLAAPARVFALPAVTATAAAGVLNLDLDGEGSASTHIVKVADLSLSDGGANGIEVTISSGSLTKAGGEPVAFQVAVVERGAAQPSSGDFTAVSGSFSTGASAEKDLYIKYLPASLQDPGVYAADIDIHVSDKP